MPSQFYQDNTTSRQRLESVLRGLAEEDFARVTPSSGWTVSALIAHLAFWERRVFVLVRRWKENGMDDAPVDANMINDASKPLWAALDAHTAVELCLALAKETDAEIETITPEFLAAIEASGNFIRLNRSLHRNDHLGEIEALLPKTL